MAVLAPFDGPTYLRHDFCVKLYDEREEELEIQSLKQKLEV